MIYYKNEDCNLLIAYDGIEFWRVNGVNVITNTVSSINPYDTYEEFEAMPFNYRLYNYIGIVKYHLLLIGGYECRYIEPEEI